MGRKRQVDELVAELAAAADLEKMMEKKDWEMGRMMQMLRSPRGRQVIASRRKLARLHSRLVATRYAPFAVQRLCQLLMDEKPELRLKSAVSILTLAGLGKSLPKKHEPEKPEETQLSLTDEEARAVLQLLSRKKSTPPCPNAKSPQSPGLTCPGDNE